MLPYRIYLLTCWQDEDATTEPQKWLFRLEEPRTGEQYGFTDLEALTAFLRERLKEADSNSQIKA